MISAKMVKIMVILHDNPGYGIAGHMIAQVMGWRSGSYDFA